jgi:hypothetical protein
MLMTIKEARTKTCPQMSGWVASSFPGNAPEFCTAYCEGNQCPMWQWAKPPILTRFVHDGNFLKRYKFKNYPVPSAEHDEDCNIFLTEAQEAIKDWKPVPPHGDGWKLESVAVEEEDEWGDFVARFVRDSDPEAQGYCGLAGQGQGVVYVKG